MEARERAMKQDWVAPEIGANRTVPGTVNAALVSRELFPPVFAEIAKWLRARFAGVLRVKSVHRSASRSERRGASSGGSTWGCALPAPERKRDAFGS
jgi:hypothetical protein